MFDTTVGKAIDAIAAIPTVEAQKANIEFLREKFVAAEKEISKLKEENIDLSRENRALVRRACEAEEKLKSMEYNPLIVDIGPCKIKIDKDKSMLDGYYCPKCDMLLQRGEYDFLKDILVCLCCKGVQIKGVIADSAKEAFMKRCLGKQP